MFGLFWSPPQMAVLDEEGNELPINEPVRLTSSVVSFYFPSFCTPFREATPPPPAFVFLVHRFLWLMFGDNNNATLSIRVRSL